MDQSYQKNIQELHANRERSLVAEALIDMSHLSSTEDVTHVPRSSGVLSADEIEWTEQYDVTALVDLLVTQKVKAVDLLHAFRKRATLAQQLTNCLTELLDEAIPKAQACDEHLAKTGTPLGPLHGVPVSVKDQIGIAGHKNNVAFVAWTDRVSQEDADIVKWLTQQGAIVFARTSQPQVLMHLETSNNIFGATTNPRNRELTCGGSTGGEAALMAIRGTPMGIGGDIGGSIRCPAALNGLYGFKPSVGRISKTGAAGTVPGCDSIKGTLGPFTRSYRDLELFCRLYSRSARWELDSSLIPTPFHSSPRVETQRKIRIGIIRDDEVVSPLPPVQRVLDLVAAKLFRSDQIELVPFKPYKHQEAWEIITANYFEDGGATIRKICATSGEPLRPLSEWILNECAQNEKLVAETLQGRKAARDEFQEAYCDHWNASGVDAVIAPVTPSVAPPLNTTRSWGYTSIWNLLDYPAISFPASDMVQGWEVDLASENYVPRTPTEKDIYANYDPDVAQRMPVGLQIVGKRLQEGRLLEDMALIEQILRQD